MFVLILSNYLNFNIIYVLMKTIQQDFRPLFFLFRTPFDTGQLGSTDAHMLAKHLRPILDSYQAATACPGSCLPSSLWTGS